MALQPSASRTALLLACPRPFDPALELEPDPPGEAARYGSAFHAVLAACLRSKAKPLERSPAYVKEVDRASKAYEVRSATAELAGHVKSSVQVLRTWLKREGLEVAQVETAHAIKPDVDGSASVREIPPHDEEHRYEVEPGEIPGTLDLVARSSHRLRTVVIDHKTGGGESDGFARPSTIGQMRTLGLIARGAAEVGIFHADRRGLPIVYAEPYERAEQRAHVRDLHAALERVGQGFLRPGDHCARCPARTTCPAHTADLLAESTAALVESANTLAVEPVDPRALLALPDPSAPALPLEARAAALYELLKRFRKLDEAGSAEIRRLVKAGLVVETRDGKILGLRAQTYEVLSKKSVLEALGKIAGEKELKRLREKGAIREATREMLVGEK